MGSIRGYGGGSNPQSLRKPSNSKESVRKKETPVGSLHRNSTIFDPVTKRVENDPVVTPGHLFPESPRTGLKPIPLRNSPVLLSIGPHVPDPLCRCIRGRSPSQSDRDKDE